MRRCLACDAAIQRRDTETSWQFRTRMTCGGDCYRAVRRAAKRTEPPPKRCPICQQLFDRRSNEGMTNWKKRATCGAACKARYISTQRTSISLASVADAWNSSRTVEDAAERLGISVPKLRGLRNRARASGLKLKRQRHQMTAVDVHGVLMTMAEIADMTGCHLETIRYRIKHGHEVLAQPQKGRRSDISQTRNDQGHDVEDKATAQDRMINALL